MPSQTTRVLTSTASGLTHRNVSTTLAARHTGRVRTVRQPRTLSNTGRTTSTNELLCPDPLNPNCACANCSTPDAMPEPALTAYTVRGYFTGSLSASGF